MYYGCVYIYIQTCEKPVAGWFPQLVSWKASLSVLKRALQESLRKAGLGLPRAAVSVVYEFDSESWCHSRNGRDTITNKKEDH